MRDDGMFLSGRRITSPPRMFLGAAENPCIAPLDWRPDRLAKKVEAGADFIQTNYIFDVPTFARFMARVRDLGLNRRVFILAGVGPLASARAARWMRSNVPGVHIPDAVIARMERAADPGEEARAHVYPAGPAVHRAMARADRGREQDRPGQHQDRAHGEMQADAQVGDPFRGRANRLPRYQRVPLREVLRRRATGPQQDVEAEHRQAGERCGLERAA